MAHTPFKVFEEFHDKVVLVSGQGPLNEIATNLGFKKIVTIDDLRKAYPQLDAVDHKRRASMVGIFYLFQVKSHHFKCLSGVQISLGNQVPTLHQNCIQNSCCRGIEKHSMNIQELPNVPG